MNEAPKGLVMAAPKAPATLSLADALASASVEEKTAALASLNADVGLAPVKAKMKPETEDMMEADEGADGDAEDAAGGDEPQKAPKGKKAKAAPAAASQDRIKVVAAAVSDDAGCKGKAALALSMLADDDFAALSGSALVKLIGKTPVDGASASSENPDDAARAEMQAAITSTGNSNIDANGKPGASVQQNSASVWDQAHTLNNFIPA